MTGTHTPEPVLPQAAHAVQAVPQLQPSGPLLLPEHFQHPPSCPSPHAHSPAPFSCCPQRGPHRAALLIAPHLLECPLSFPAFPPCTFTVWCAMRTSLTHWLVFPSRMHAAWGQGSLAVLVSVVRTASRTPGVEQVFNKCLWTEWKILRTNVRNRVTFYFGRHYKSLKMCWLWVQNVMFRL